MSVVLCRPGAPSLVGPLNFVVALVLLRSSPSVLWAGAPKQAPVAEAPAVRIIATYEGASPQVMVDVVTAALEQQLRGLDGVTSIRSESRPGRVVITVYFKRKIDPHVAAVLVQNRVSLALPQLPDAVSQSGVDVRLGAGNRPPALWATLSSEDHDLRYLSNYAEIQLRWSLERVPRVRDVQTIGASPLSPRVLLDPDRLAARGLDLAEVVEALRKHESPRPGADTQLSRLQALVEGMPNLVIKANGEGLNVRLRDVATVELGARPNTDFARWNGKPVVALALDAEDEDAAEVRDAALRELERLRRRLPDGITLKAAPDFVGTDGAVLLVEVRLPDAAALERVEAAVARAERIVKAIDGVDGVLSTGDTTSGGRLYVRVKDAAAARPLIRKCLAEQAASCRVIDLKTRHLPPEQRTAVSLIVQNDQDVALRELQELADSLRAELANSPRLVDAWSDFRADAPQLHLDIDRQKLARYDVSDRRVLEVLAASGAPGAILDPRFDVRLGKEEGRWTPDALKGLKVRNGTGEMVPLAALVSVKEVSGPRQINHLDGWPTALVSADLAPGATIEEARKACRDAVRKAGVPKGFRVLLSGTGMEKREDVTKNR